MSAINSTPNTTCVAAGTDSKGTLYSLVVITDWEAFQSFVYETRDMEQDGKLIYEYDGWLTDMWVSEEGALYACDDDGNVHFTTGGNWSIKNLDKERGLTSIFGLGGTLFSCGKKGAVYTAVKGRWQRIETGTRCDLYCVRASSDADAYAVGEQGCVLHYDGKQCRVLELPTNTMLNATLCLVEDRLAYVCGENGVAMVGSGSEWNFIDVESKMNLHALTVHQGDVLIGAGARGIFRLEGNVLVEYKMNVPAYGLSSSGEFLAASGNEFAVRFDGRNWKGKRYGD